MKFTNFYKLRKAAANLDFNFLANKISELGKNLTKKGKKLEVENIAATQEGIFYIQPDSGMATRVVLYDSDQKMKLRSAPKHDLYVNGYDDPKIYRKFHKYHLLRCNQVAEAEKAGWGKGYRIAQRDNASFYYRIVSENAVEIKEKDIYQEIENQKLIICENCFLKINSLLEGVQDINRENFELKYFFDVDFFATWCRYGEYVEDKGTLVKMYPKDWEEISRVRKEQVQHICEGCERDFSEKNARKYLFVHPTDHVSQKVSYVKLQSLCLGCLSDEPSREYIKELPEYEEYLKFIENNGDSAPDQAHAIV